MNGRPPKELSSLIVSGSVAFGPNGRRCLALAPCLCVDSGGHRKSPPRCHFLKQELVLTVLAKLVFVADLSAYQGALPIFCVLLKTAYETGV